MVQVQQNQTGTDEGMINEKKLNPFILFFFSPESFLTEPKVGLTVFTQVEGEFFFLLKEKYSCD